MRLLPLIPPFLAFDDDIDLVSDHLPEIFDFGEDLDESFLFSSFSLTQL